VGEKFLSTIKAVLFLIQVAPFSASFSSGRVEIKAYKIMAEKA